MVTELPAFSTPGALVPSSCTKTAACKQEANQNANVVGQAGDFPLQHWEAAILPKGLLPRKVSLRVCNERKGTCSHLYSSRPQRKPQMHLRPEEEKDAVRSCILHGDSPPPRDFLSLQSAVNCSSVSIQNFSSCHTDTSSSPVDETKSAASDSQCLSSVSLPSAEKAWLSPVPPGTVLGLR